MDTNFVAQMIVDSVRFAKHAHIDLPFTPNDAIRFHDRTTPYIVHPIWCAMTIMTETTLSEPLRLNGCQALMWHDVLEDTHVDLPIDTDREVRQMIQDMSFENFADEKTLIWTRSKEIRLLKLYDKASNLLDASHYSIDKWNNYVEFTQSLIVDVENNYGSLNIIKIAKSISVYKS